MRFAPFDGQEPGLSADEAGDDLHVEAIVLEQGRVLIRSRARSGGCEQDGCPGILQLLIGLDRLVLSHHDQKSRRGGAADGDQLVEVVLDANGLGPLRKRQFPGQDGNFRTVFFRPVHYVVSGDDTAGARHIDHLRPRVAGQMF